MPQPALPDDLQAGRWHDSFSPDLARYLRERSSKLPLPEGSVLPDDNLSIANVPATLAALLGGRLAGAAPPLPQGLWRDLAPGVRRVVWLIFDAVGWLHLQQLLAEESRLSLARLARNGRLFPLTSIFPSTTTSALTTLWTGVPAARHGLVGHEMYLRDFGLVMDTLGFSPAGEPRRQQLLQQGLVLEQFLPVPGLAETLAGQGIVTRALIHLGLAETALSRLLFRGVREVIGGVTSADMWVRLRQAVATYAKERLLLVAYWDEVDRISHYHGPGSQSWYAELRNLAFSLEQEFLLALGAEERAGTLLVISADHGQIPLAAESVVRLADHPELKNYLLVPPTGGPRSTYLFVRQGQVEPARRYVQRFLADQFTVFNADLALQAGLLGSGPAAVETPHRLGDLVLLARGEHLLEQRERQRPLLGGHGGLSPQEMLVPLLMVRLD